MLFLKNIYTSTYEYTKIYIFRTSCCKNRKRFLQIFWSIKILKIFKKLFSKREQLFYFLIASLWRLSTQDIMRLIWNKFSITRNIYRTCRILARKKQFFPILYFINNIYLWMILWNNSQTPHQKEPLTGFLKNIKSENIFLIPGGVYARAMALKNTLVHL